MKKDYHSFIRGCSKRVFKKYYGNRIDVDGYQYSFDDYSKLIQKFKSISVGDLIYNSYNNIFEPVKEVKCRWISFKKYYSIKNKNIQILDFLMW